MAVVYLTGFEHQTVSTAGAGIFSAIAGSPSIDTTVKRNGNASLQINPTGISESDEATVSISGSPTVLVARFAVRLDSLPAADSHLWRLWEATSSNEIIFGFVAASGKFGLRQSDTDTWVEAASTVTAGQWYVIDIRGNVGANPWLADWRIDGVDQTQFSRANAASTFSGIIFGTGLAHAYTANFDDVVVGNASGDYPFGDGKVLGYAPNADGSHAVGADTFRLTTNNGGAFTTITNSTTTAWEQLDDWPVNADGDGSDDWVEKTDGTTGTNYVEIAFADPGASESAPRAVCALAAIDKAANQAANLQLYLVENTTEDATAIFNADPGSQSNQYKRAVYTAKPSGGAWTRQALVDAKVRIKSTDVTPDVRVKALLLEADYAVAAAASLVIPRRPERGLVMR